MQKLERGEVVIAPDPYSNQTAYRPFAIISDEEYPFYPHGYLGVPVTTQDRPNTYQIHEQYVVWEDDSLDVEPSFINPMSPSQVNDCRKSLLGLSDRFMDSIAMRVKEAVGLHE
jgi:hypothetical protein